MLKVSQHTSSNKEESIVTRLLDESIGYTYGYSYDNIESLPEYDRELESYTSYGNVIGADEFEEYAISLFVRQTTTGMLYQVFVGYEDGLGHCNGAKYFEFNYLTELENYLESLEESYSRWN